MQKALIMMRILIVLVFSSLLAYSQLPPFLFKKLQLPLRTVAEANAFDLKGNGPYSSVADGRVLKYQGPIVGFTDFATTSPLRTKEKCDGTNDLNLLTTCGRPLGLGFYYKTGDLYVVDIQYGLLSVGPNGGLATQLVTGVDGVPFAFLDALDIDQRLGVVYFVDSGPIFRTGNISLIIQSGDTSGRLFKYDISTKKVSLLLSGLSGPAGVALSANGSYVLVTEYIANRIRRFWLSGANANSAQVFTKLDGNADNIKRTILGDFWVAVNVVKQQSTFALGQRINLFGNVIASLNLTAQFPNSFSEIQEYFGRLYIVSLIENFVGVYGV